MHTATMLTQSADAINVCKSLAIDNNQYVKSNVSGKFIRTEVRSESMNTLLSTLDDIIFCQMVAETLV